MSNRTLLVSVILLLIAGWASTYLIFSTAPPAAVVVKERNEVIARRGALEVELAKVRTDWAMVCITERTLVFESDRAMTCRKNAIELYPDVITQQLLSEFNGDLTTPTQAKEQ